MTVLLPLLGTVGGALLIGLVVSAARRLPWPKAVILFLAIYSLSVGIGWTSHPRFECMERGNRNSLCDGWSQPVLFSLAGTMVAIGGLLALLVVLAPAAMDRERRLLRWAGGLMLPAAVGGGWLLVGPPAFTLLVLGNLRIRWR